MLLRNQKSDKHEKAFLPLHLKSKNSYLKKIYNVEEVFFKKFACKHFLTNFQSIINSNLLSPFLNGRFKAHKFINVSFY